MRKVVFDIETSNFFEDVGKNDPTLLDISIVAIHDSETGEYTTYLVEELPQLWPILERTNLLIGYNSEHFDIPLLNKYYPGDLTRIKSIDLFQIVRETTGRWPKLDNLARATLGETKVADGLKAGMWWKQGEIEKVREYCVDDVRITKELYDHALNKGFLKYTDGSDVKKAPLNTSEWEKDGGSAMTYTMGF